VAELAGALADDDQEYASVATSLAVLSGIAAADAACCIALGRRSRAQDHHQAEILVSQITPGGSAAAASLRRLLNLKDEAQYGVIHVGDAELRGALRRGKQLVSFATAIARS
jgi:hypothetical protein